MSVNERISTDNAPKPVGLYPHARRVGNLLFLSGVGPRVAGSDANDSSVPGLKLDRNGNFITFDFEAQCRSVFENVRIILEASGSSWDQLVDVHCLFGQHETRLSHLTTSCTPNTSKTTCLAALPSRSSSLPTPYCH